MTNKTTKTVEENKLDEIISDIYGICDEMSPGLIFNVDRPDLPDKVLDTAIESNLFGEEGDMERFVFKNKEILQKEVQAALKRRKADIKAKRDLANARKLVKYYINGKQNDKSK